MRTTLDLEEDVLFAVKEIARYERISTGSVASRILRLGLNASNGKPKMKRSDDFPVLRPHGDIITLEHVQKIMDEEGI